MREFLVDFALRDYFARSDLHRNGCSFKSFQNENFNSKDGFNSNAVFGYIVYQDEVGQQGRCESIMVKLSPIPNLRTRYMDITFCNEIFMYSKIIPFYATLNNTVLNVFPKFYYGNMVLGDANDENAIVMLENLAIDGYRTTDSKTFLDFQHLLLMVKKLARFHAFSYCAKIKKPRIFYSLVNNLVNTRSTATREMLGCLNLMNDYYTEMLKNDPHYGPKVDRIRELLQNADHFMENVFSVAEEPVAVLCHGDFLRNNLMVKYDSAGNPVDVKFIDLPSAQYCTPIVDLALILYMNADQKMRDDHWDDLLDAYCISLSETFPDVPVPTKDQILKEFKIKSLNAFLITTFFIPRMMRIEEPGYEGDKDFFYPEYAEYVNIPWYNTPGYVMFGVLRKTWKPNHIEKVVDVLKDIIDRGFVD